MVLTMFMHGGDRGAAPIMWVCPQITQITQIFFCFIVKIHDADGGIEKSGPTAASIRSYKTP